MQLVTVAAWFHDTGFSTCYKGHEYSSQNIATKFLSEHNVSDKSIQIICECIEATKMPQSPKSLLAKVLCDADLMHLSTPEFFYRKLLLRREWEVFCDNSVSDIEWHLLNKKFLEEHNYWTDYGKSILREGKHENLKKVENIISYYHDSN